MIIKHRNIIKNAIMVLLFSVSLNAQAVKFNGEVGVHLGGDTLVTGQDLNGTFNIDAGSLFSAGVGAHFDLTNNSHIRTLVGFKSDSVDIVNETITDSPKSVTFLRFPIDVMYFYQTQNWNFGAGLTYHVKPDLYGNDITHTHFKNSLGYAAEIDFRLGEFFYLGTKVTIIEYTKENSSKIINGNSIGLVLGFVFGSNDIQNVNSDLQFY